MNKVLVLDAGHSKDATAGKQTLNGSQPTPNTKR